MIVGGIENLTDNLRHCVLLHCTHIIALIEHIHIKARGLCAPKTENADALAILAGNIHIVGYRLYLVAVTLFNVVVLIVPALVNPALKENINGLLLTGNKPNVTAGEPEIGELGLPAVDELLLENTVFVKNRIALCKISLTCKTVKVAGCKSAETAVAETCIRLAVIKLVELYTEILECGFHCFCEIEIVQVVLE